MSSGTDSPLKTNSGQAHCACAVINEGSGNDIESASSLSNGSTYLNITKCLLILGDHIHMDDFLIAKLANFTVKYNYQMSNGKLTKDCRAYYH